MSDLPANAPPWGRPRTIATAAAPCALLVALGLASGCSTTAETFDVSESGATAASEGAFDSNGDDGDPGGSTGGDAEVESSGESGGESTSGDGGTSGGAPPEGLPGCPESLPEGWFYCQDFEAVDDPGDVFFEYYDAEGAFVLADDAAASGQRSMRASYREGVEGAGWFSVSFGQNPIIFGQRPQVAENEKFEDVYWRFRVKMQAGWPDVGPRKLTRITAFAHENWGQAMVGNLWSAGADVVLAADPASCVLDGQVLCEGYNDEDALQQLGQLIGSTPLFSKGYADEWHCVEAHVKLNTPGEVDGVFEFWVDDNLESGRYDIDWRGVWTDYGLNLVTIENFWTDGAPQPLDRWVDDLVISTQPIGCE